MPLAAIALGANLGEREQTLRSAADALRTLGQVVAVSSFWDTEPVGYTDQPRFLNGAALLYTELSPSALLDALLLIERQHGRDRTGAVPKGPRTLDLDLLLYDDVVMATETLVLPHPEMHRRAFVLQPLAEIAPDWTHPVLHCTVVELLHGLPAPD